MGTIEEKSSGQWTQFILGMLFAMLMMNGYEERSKKYIEASKKMNATVVEYIKGIKVIKAFNQSASSYGKFSEGVSNNRNAMLDWYLSVCFAMVAAMEILPSTLLFVLPVSLILFMKGSIEVGTMVMCVLLSYASYKPLIKAMTYMDTMANVRIIFGEINDIMKLPELERPDYAKEVKGSDVTFKNMCFGYDELLSNYILPKLQDAFKKAKSVDIIVAFLIESGVKLLKEDLKQLVDRNIPIRILTGNYLNIT